MSEYDTLLTQIAEHARHGGRANEPMPDPLLQTAIDEAERRLGFRLHPLLAAAYRTISNGGFGPDYELLGLISNDGNGQQAVDAYLELRTTGAGTKWAWPEGVLPIMDWGCGMLACVDCRSDEGTVLLFEPNPGDPDLAWYLDSPTLPAWFEHYVNDTGWWNQTNDGALPLPAWPHAPARSRN
jgi:hypothetical protein